MPDWRERIVSDPEVLGGKPVVRGTRVPVELILEKLAAELTTEQILTEYPFLTREDVLAALAYAADALGSEAAVVGGAFSRGCWPTTMCRARLSWPWAAPATTWPRVEISVRARPTIR